MIDICVIISYDLTSRLAWEQKAVGSQETKGSLTSFAFF